MNHRVVVDGLRILLGGAGPRHRPYLDDFLPWLSGEVARDFLAEASMRWPIGGLSMAGLVCAATIVYQSFTVGGPAVCMLLLWCRVLAGAGIALLMKVMRGRCWSRQRP